MIRWFLGETCFLSLFFSLNRSNHRRCFANLTEKYLWWSLFLIELQAFRPATLSKRDRCFSVKFSKMLRTPILKNMYKRLPRSQAVFCGCLCSPTICPLPLSSVLDPWSLGPRRSKYCTTKYNTII